MLMRTSFSTNQAVSITPTRAHIIQVAGTGRMAANEEAVSAEEEATEVEVDTTEDQVTELPPTLTMMIPKSTRGCKQQKLMAVSSWTTAIYSAEYLRRRIPLPFSLKSRR